MCDKKKIGYVQRLTEDLNSSGVEYIKVKEKKICGIKYHRVYFLNEDDLERMVFFLTLKPRDSIYGRIDHTRINRKKLYIYIVPLVRR